MVDCLRNAAELTQESGSLSYRSSGYHEIFLRIKVANSRSIGNRHTLD